MSSYLLAKAIRTRSTTGNTRLLLLIMADAASDSGHVSMTIEEMSARANAHRRTITRALEDMIRSRIITGGPEYCLILDDEPLFEVRGVTFAEPDEGGDAPSARAWQWTEMGYDTREGGFYAKRDGAVMPLPPVDPALTAEAQTAMVGVQDREAFLRDGAAVLRENLHAALVAGDPHDLSLHGPDWGRGIIQETGGMSNARSAVQMAAALQMMGAEPDAGPGVQIAPERTITWGTGPDVPGFPPANTMVGALLRAAGVEADPLVPLYWVRPGHEDDVRQLEADTGMTAAQIIETCRGMHLKAGPIRRLTALAPMIAREKRRPR